MEKHCWKGCIDCEPTCEFYGDCQDQKLMENQLRPTPGPWELNPDQEHKTEVKIRKGITVGFLVSMGTLVDLEELEANAALIAAAPELLEALKLLTLRAEAFNYLPNYTAISQAVDEARKAIAKAEATQ